MLDSSSDPRRLPWRSRLAAVLHWRRLIRLPVRLTGLCVRILWIAFFVLAVGFLLLRYLVVPQIAEHRERIEQEISRELGLKVQMASLQANWDGLRPELSIQDLRVFDKQDRVALELPRIQVAVAWASLLRWHLTLHRLEIDRPELSIRRLPDGTFLIAGIRIDPSAESGSSGFGDFVLAQHEIVVRQARLTWTDEKRGAPPLTLDKVNLRIENFARSHRFALLASPPSAYSANLDIRGDLHGHGFKRLEDWRGQLYLALDEADLAVWQKWLDYPLVLPRGRGGVRAWVNFNGPHLDGLTADVALADVAMRFASKLPMLDLQYLKGHLKMTADERKIGFVAEDLSLATRDGVQIGPTRIGLDYTLPAKGRMSKGRFVSGEIDVRMLAQLAAYLPLPDKVARNLVTAQPSGRIHKVELDWEGNGDKVAHFAVDADLQDLTMRPFGGIPGVDGLSVKVHGNERSGNFRLAMRKGALHVPAALHEGDVPIDVLDIGGRWNYEVPKKERTERLTVHLDSARVSNPHIDMARFSGYWQAREKGSGYMDLQAQAGSLSLENLWRYMPLHSAKFVPQWMQKSLRGGTAQSIRFHLAGELDHIPFQKYPGIFRLDARLVDARIDSFADGWPGTRSTQGSFEMDRQRMTIMIKRGVNGGVTVTDTKVEIPDIMIAGKQVLTVDGTASGTTPAFLAYINASRLGGERVGNFTRDVRASGEGSMALHLNVPLHESRNTTVKGSYRFKNNTLRLIPGLPEFSGATGTLGFTDVGVSLSDTDAVFLGKRIHARGDTEPDGTMRFDAQGTMAVAGLRKLVPNPGWRHLAGESAADVTIRVRHAQTDVTVDSNMVGMSSDLPRPFRKSAGERWPVRVNLRVDSGSEQHSASVQSWRISLDSLLDASWVEQCRGSTCAIQRGAIGVREPAALPAQGWNIGGSLGSVDVAVWQPILDEILPQSEGGSQDQSDVVVTARAGQVLAGGQVFRQVRTRARLHENMWTAHFDGPDVAGDMTWQDAGNGRLYARLTRLSLQKQESAPDTSAASAPEASGTAAQSVQPGSLPEVDVVADDFQLRAMKLGKLTLQAASQGDQWQVRHVALSDSDMDLSGHGSWQNGDTRLEFQLKSENAGSMLGHFGLSNSIHKGKLDFSGTLDWKGAPYAPDLPSLNGDLKLKASSGAFVEMEPGPFGRLLGIMSLQALPRRLIGNFDDVIAKGFAFDSIQGDMHVASGILHMTHDLEVRGPAARVFISGSTDLINETHNLVMRVQPTMSDPISLGAQVAVGVANPMVGIGLYLGQKIVGDPLEKIFSYDLSVTGPWSDPKVEKKAEKLEDRLESVAKPSGVPPTEASGAQVTAP